MHEEELDKLIRDAASQHHPPYDDAAWSKMEQMLDEHLPEKKDRRRPILWLLSFLLLGGAAYWGINTYTNHSSNNNTRTGLAVTSPASKPGDAAAAASKNTATADQKVVDGSNGADGSGNEKNTAANTPTVGNTAAATPGTTNNSLHAVPVLKNGRNKITIAAGTATADDNAPANSNRNKLNQKGRTTAKIKNGNTGTEENTAASKDNDDTNPDMNPGLSINNPGNTIAAIPAAPLTNKKDTAATTAKPAGAEKKAVQVTATGTADKTKKNSKRFADRFGITASVGADVAYVELSKAGKLRPSIGAGLTYAVSKHFSVSSGVYAAQKVYTALPYQYKFAGGSSYPNLSVIKANCKVLEIPVNVYYSFGAGKKHNWIAGAGLSTLLMKKEDYDYVYVLPSGQTYSYVKSVSNENKHYFSVLNLSAGYQYQVSKKVGLIAEPYVKLPLSGIGLGKINLNSTGVMVSAVIKPFSKKK